MAAKRYNTKRILNAGEIRSGCQMVKLRKGYLTLDQCAMAAKGYTQWMLCAGKMRSGC